MKFNKWTLGLAAVGVVSLTSAARADEKPSAVQTALSNTTISGYVSASANWGLTGGYYNSPAVDNPSSKPYQIPGIPFQPASKANGFNLDVVKLTIAKPEDATPWAAGYDVDLLFGPDAVNYNTSVNGTSGSDYAIKQAYITLNTPIGNGVDFKVGVFDSPLGYEVFDAASNPNYTRSWGYAIEPTELTGLEATYKLNDQLSFLAGIANTSSAGINNRNNYNGSPEQSVWHKAYFADVTYTAPSSLGWLAGSTAFAGVLYGPVDTLSGNPGYDHPNTGGNQVNYYGGLTLNTPWKQITSGVAFDYVQNYNGGGVFSYTLPSDAVITKNLGDNIVAIGLYTTYKATDKLSFNGRAEYVESDIYASGNYFASAQLVEVTGTVEYDLWANVVSRVELRWDQNVSYYSNSHYATNVPLTGSTGQGRDDVGLYANLVYKF